MIKYFDQSVIHCFVIQENVVRDRSCALEQMSYFCDDT